MVLRLLTPRSSPSFPPQCFLQGSDPARVSRLRRDINGICNPRTSSPNSCQFCWCSCLFFLDPGVKEWAPVPFWGIFPRLVLNFSCPCSHHRSLRSTFGKVGGYFLVSLRLPYMATTWFAGLISTGISCWREGNAHAIQLLLRRNRI